MFKYVTTKFKKVVLIRKSITITKKIEILSLQVFLSC